MRASRCLCCVCVCGGGGGGGGGGIERPRRTLHAAFCRASRQISSILRVKSAAICTDTFLLAERMIPQPPRRCQARQRTEYPPRFVRIVCTQSRKQVLSRWARSSNTVGPRGSSMYCVKWESEKTFAWKWTKGLARMYSSARCGVQGDSSPLMGSGAKPQ